MNNTFEPVGKCGKSVVAIYGRVSLEEQTDGFSLAAQEEILKAYAKQKGFEVYDIYIDGGESGKNFERPQVQRMFRDLEQNKLDTILIWKVDRLSRNNTDVLNLIDNFLKPRKKRILVSTGDIDSSTTMGYMFISLLSTFARYERESIIDRVKMGMEKRAKEGKTNGGKMLGYDSVDGFLKINLEEAKIVQTIFRLRAERWGYKKIANYLNTIGKKTKNNNKFKLEAIRVILNNERYLGKNVWGKQRDWTSKRRAGKAIPIKSNGEHDGIIDITLWDKVQEINKEQNESFTSNRNFNGNFFLTGVLKCPMCGAGTVMHKVKKRDGSGYHLYYMCQNNHVGGSKVCKTNLIRKDWIEDRILGVIKTLIENDDLITDVIKKLQQNELINIDDLLKQRKLLTLQLEPLKQRQRKIDIQYNEGVLNVRSYNRLIEEVDDEIEKLEKQINELNREIEVNSPLTSISANMVKEAFENFNSAFEAASDEDKKMLIRALIREIHVTVDRKEIKNISFWFFNTDGFPSNESGGTVP